MGRCWGWPGGPTFFAAHTGRGAQACFAQIKSGTLLFSGSTTLADTWLWKDGDWHDVSHIGGAAPPARALGAMAAYGEGALLFGGYGAVTQSLNDTWTWTPSDGWTELTHTLAAAPPGRSYHTMQATGDARAPSVVLFGGTDRSDEAHDTAMGDTWIFSGGQWTNPGLAPPLAPNPRWGHSMACTPPAWLEPGGASDTQCVLFGGADLSEDDHFDDTWMLNGPKHGHRGPDVEATTRDFRGSWKQSQPGVARPGPKPTGRWSFQIASCGKGALMAGGSIGYR